MKFIFLVLSLALASLASGRVAKEHKQPKTPPSGQPGNNQPGNSQSGNTQPGNSQSGNTQPGNTQPGSSQSGSSSSLCGQEQSLTQNGYLYNNNEWGKSAASSGSQCLSINGGSSGGASWSTTWTWAGSPNNVKSYPFVGKTLTPKIISQISSMQSSFSWSYSSTNIACDVSYDIFTAANANHATSSGDYEIMIWLASYGGVGPISATGSPIATPTVAGHSWKLYYGSNGSQKTYSFITNSGPITSFSADVKEFFTYLTQSQNYPASSQYLITFQGGTEAFTGGPTTFTVSSFSASLN